jgi:hypothetical protein
MEWLHIALSKDPSFLIISATLAIGIFVLATRKAHANYLEKIKKIKKTDNSFHIK